MKFIREDEQNVELALSLGFEIDDSKKAERGLTFKRGATIIWAMRVGWQVADVIDDYYCNHRPQESLKEALQGEGARGVGN